MEELKLIQIRQKIAEDIDASSMMHLAVAFDIKR
jgi:hypothetical protein